jgi:hypothetical protein
LLSLILGGFFGVGGAFVGTFLETSEEDPEEQEKLEELRETFTSDGWIARVQRGSGVE